MFIGVQMWLPVLLAENHEMIQFCNRDGSPLVAMYLANVCDLRL
jgi:hypothetical protein